MDFHVMKQVRKLRTRSILDLKPAYHKVLPISVPKHQDLMSLLKSGIIPQVYKDFYTNIPVDKQLSDCTPGGSEDESMVD